MLKGILVVVLVCGLSGCGIMSKNDDYEKYAQALADDSRADADSISAQSKSIYLTYMSAKKGDPLADSLLAVIAMDRIRALQPTPLNIIKPTGGYDVLNRHAGTLISTTVAGVLGYFSYDAIKQLAWGGGGSYNFNNSAPVDISDSMNFIEQHQTYSDGASANISPYVARPEVVTQPAPVIVK
ncbi:MAG TPA: hypothetical protein ENJ30_01985 [Desulfobulbaceae bacterium]|nr:hypothetical protein [Desulfobulbaceae bacterium]